MGTEWGTLRVGCDAMREKFVPILGKAFEIFALTEHSTDGIAKAKYIVRACNAHDAMLAICESLAELIESGDIPNVEDWSEYGRLLSAIAAAKGES